MDQALTIVVVTRDRPRSLPRCLAALERLERTSWKIDLLVVDDGTASASEVAVAAAGAGADLVRTGGAGVPAARNAGAERASTSYVLFTDDDCVAEPSWAERLADRLAEDSDVVGGPTVNGDARDLVAKAAQLVANAPARLNGDGRPLFVPASNFGCRREVLVAVPFDESYTGRGTEDRDWFERVGKLGYRVRYVPGAVVQHFPELQVASFLSKSARYGRGNYLFRARHRAGRLEPPGFYVELIQHGLREGLVTGLLVGAAQVATAIGYATEAVTSYGERRVAAGRR